MKIIVAPRGEFDDNALSIKHLKKKVFLMLMKMLSNKLVFHATTEQEKKQIKKIFSNNPIFICMNIPFIPQIGNQEIPHLKRSGELKILYLSRILKNKNLLFTIEAITDSNINNRITLNIVGPIEDNNYWEKCKKVMKHSGTNITINYHGPQVHDLAMKNYLTNDLFFLPTFFDAFSHVIYESLLHGCPVLISDNTPWANGELDTGVFAFHLERKDRFVDTINKLTNLNYEEYMKLRERTKIRAFQDLNLSDRFKEYKRMFS